MADLTPELESLYLLYGTAIPPLPRQPRIAQRTVRWDTTLDAFAQRAANAREYGYNGDVTALIRHAVSLFLMALAKSSNKDVSPVRFQMEVLRQEQEEEDYSAFVQFAQATIREAEGHMTTVVGRGPAAVYCWAVVRVIDKHPSKAVRLRMQSYLTTNGRFVKMVRE
ncbi:hypothetical protein LCGC14_1359010, partial [marine sediment metagenome]